jgi:hypothetical protein
VIAKGDRVTVANDFAKTARYFFPFLLDFFAFFEGAAFFAAALAFDPLPLKAASHPSAYF